MHSAVIRVNLPNGVTLALISAGSIKGWLEVLMLATSIVCTILVTRHEISKKDSK